jgi:hypothetical protein
MPMYRQLHNMANEGLCLAFQAMLAHKVKLAMSYSGDLEFNTSQTDVHHADRNSFLEALYSGCFDVPAIFFAAYGGGNCAFRTNLSGHTWSERVLTKYKAFVNAARSPCPELVAEINNARDSRSSVRAMQSQSESCKAYILDISTDMLHSVLDNSASLPTMRLLQASEQRTKSNSIA